MTRRICWSWLRVGCAVLLGIFLRLDDRSLAQSVPPRKFSVQLIATVQESPPQINLSWPDEGDANGYRISRRTLNSGWHELDTIESKATSFSDSSVELGVPYEYQIIKATSVGYAGYGYIRSGIRVPVADNPGTLILLVERSIAGAIASEVTRLQRDLTAEGWGVIPRTVSASDSPESVKKLIKEFYTASPENVKALFLLGHIPVPYSGDLAPDGHPNHLGAWPADAYYADVDGNWTDMAVDNTTAERPTNWNTPGDGKLDQSFIPSPVELIVGRVDLSNLTCYSNKSDPRSEIDLTRQYLNKDHAFRTGELAVERRGLICDNFSDKGDDPISGSAWRNFSALLGPDKITEVGWDGYLPEATTNTFLWSYGSGGGSYYYSTGVATSDDFALQNVNVVFTMFMGSYFGDWNNESNFLRAALGSGDVLTTSYSGFPQSLYFPMGLGETIGYATALTQNNKTNGLYPPWNKWAGGVHIALLGDPTLRLAAVRPPTNFTATSGSTVSLRWKAPNDEVIGYHVYRRPGSAGPFIRLTRQPLATTSFLDAAPSGKFTYMIRAVKLETTGSGSFLNLSPGIFANASSSGNPGGGGNPSVRLALEQSGETTVLKISGDQGQDFRVQDSTDLQEWRQIGTGTIGESPAEFPVVLEHSKRCLFFRAIK